LQKEPLNETPHRKKHATTGYREATREEIIDRGQTRPEPYSPRFSSQRLTANYLIPRMATRPYKSFTLIYIDKRHRFIATPDIFRGTIDGASGRPREVVIEALNHQAAAVILAHSRASGVAEPSQADPDSSPTACAMHLSRVDIRVLDHGREQQRVGLAERALI
jgi:DNA repair protein RadC